MLRKMITVITRVITPRASSSTTTSGGTIRS
jgi:hypothetical protein